MTKSKCLSIIKDFLADVSEISEKNELLETTQLGYLVYWRTPSDPTLLAFYWGSVLASLASWEVKKMLLESLVPQWDQITFDGRISIFTLIRSFSENIV